MMLSRFNSSASFFSFTRSAAFIVGLPSNHCSQYTYMTLSTTTSVVCVCIYIYQWLPFSRARMCLPRYRGYLLVHGNNNNNNNNNTSICKAHNVSIRAESEAPIFLIQSASLIHLVCRCASLATISALSQSMTSFSSTAWSVMVDLWVTILTGCPTCRHQWRWLWILDGVERRFAGHKSATLIIQPWLLH